MSSAPSSPTATYKRPQRGAPRGLGGGGMDASAPENAYASYAAGLAGSPFGDDAATAYGGGGGVNDAISEFDNIDAVSLPTPVGNNRLQSLTPVGNGGAEARAGMPPMFDGDGYPPNLAPPPGNLGTGHVGGRGAQRTHPLDSASAALELENKLSEGLLHYDALRQALEPAFRVIHQRLAQDVADGLIKMRGMGGPYLEADFHAAISYVGMEEDLVDLHFIRTLAQQHLHAATKEAASMHLAVPGSGTGALPGSAFPTMEPGRDIVAPGLHDNDEVVGGGQGQGSPMDNGVNYAYNHPLQNWGQTLSNNSNMYHHHHHPPHNSLGNDSHSSYGNNGPTLFGAQVRYPNGNGGYLSQHPPPFVVNISKAQPPPQDSSASSGAGNTNWGTPNRNNNQRDVYNNQNNANHEDRGAGLNRFVSSPQTARSGGVGGGGGSDAGDRTQQVLDEYGNLIKRPIRKWQDYNPDDKSPSVQVVGQPRKLCRHWERTGQCKLGDTCNFLHTPEFRGGGLTATGNGNTSPVGVKKERLGVLGDLFGVNMALIEQGSSNDEKEDKQLKQLA